MNANAYEDISDANTERTCFPPPGPNTATKATGGIENHAHAHPRLYHASLKRDRATIVAIIARNHELPRSRLDLKPQNLCKTHWSINGQDHWQNIKCDPNSSMWHQGFACLAWPALHKRMRTASHMRTMPMCGQNLPQEPPSNHYAFEHYQGHVRGTFACSLACSS